MLIGRYWRYASAVQFSYYFLGYSLDRTPRHKRGESSEVVNRLFSWSQDSDRLRRYVQFLDNVGANATFDCWRMYPGTRHPVRHRGMLATDIIESQTSLLVIGNGDLNKSDKFEMQESGYAGALIVLFNKVRVDLDRLGVFPDLQVVNGGVAPTEFVAPLVIRIEASFPERRLNRQRNGALAKGIVFCDCEGFRSANLSVRRYFRRDIHSAGFLFLSFFRFAKISIAGFSSDCRHRASKDDHSSQVSHQCKIEHGALEVVGLLRNHALKQTRLSIANLNPFSDNPTYNNR